MIPGNVITTPNHQHTLYMKCSLRTIHKSHWHRIENVCKWCYGVGLQKIVHKTHEFKEVILSTYNEHQTELFREGWSLVGWTTKTNLKTIAYAILVRDTEIIPTT